MVPLLSVVAVPVCRPELSRNRMLPFGLVVAVPVCRPEASRNVVVSRAPPMSTANR